MTATIPIANIYYLYCYAWDRYLEGTTLLTGSESCPDLPNLLGRVLLNGMSGLVRRGLDRAYKPLEDELATVRGHIELGSSLRLYARNSRRLQCTFDELSHDVLHNQILKATLKRLYSLRNLEPTLASEARRLITRLNDVSDIRLTQACFSRVQLHRNNAYYDLLLRISQLIFEGLIPAQNGTGFKFRDVLNDEREMARVFEAFVRNFYRAELSDYRVEPLTILWDAIPLAVGPGDRLPNMRVDVYLRSDNRHIIVDTKYYAEAMQSFHGTTSFRSENLYQLFSYLRNHAASLSPKTALDGMLIYPQVGGAIDADYMIAGHKVRLATVDLSAPWQQISNRLLALTRAGTDEQKL